MRHLPLVLLSLLLTPLAYGVKFGSGSIQTVPADSIACGADGKVVFVTTRQGFLYRSEDSGNSFTELKGFHPSIVGSFPAEAVACSADGEIVYVILASRQVIKATDGGRKGIKSFYLIKGAGNQQATGMVVNPVKITCSPDGQIVYLIDERGQVHQSTNGGEGLKSFNRL
jgi:hypothetical protein